MASKNKKNDKVDIKHAPKLSVTGLKAPTRKENSTYQVFTASWKYPGKAFDEKNDSRFEGVIVEWTIDYDPKGSAVTTSKKSKKIEVITGERPTKTKKDYSRYKGSKCTESTYKFKRSDWYPCYAAKAEKFVPLYTLTKATKLKRAKRDGTRWKKLAAKQTRLVSLKTLNVLVKKNKVVSQSAMLKSAKNPKGTLYYVSKTKGLVSKRPQLPKIYGIGVRVQGWNAKTPTRKKVKKSVKDKKTGKTVTKLKDPGVATKDTVLWNPAAPTQAAYFKFARPVVPKISSSIADGAGNFKVSFTIADHDDKKDKGDTGTNHAERYDTRIQAFLTYGLYGSGTVFKTYPRKALKIKNNESTELYSTAANTVVARVPGTDITARPSMNLRLNEYILYEVQALNRGIRGNNPSWEKASKLIAWPHDVSISSITKKGAMYEITFKYGDQKVGRRLTSTFTLQQLRNYRPDQAGSDTPVDDWSEKQWVEAAAEDSGWKDVSVLGYNANLKAQTFVDRVIDATPQPFRRTYYRVVAKNSIRDEFSVYSLPFVVPGFLRIPSAKDEKVDIRACSSAENGTAIKAVVVFTKTSYERITGISTGATIPKDGSNQPTYYELSSSSGKYVRTQDTTVRANKDYYRALAAANSNGTELSWDTFDHAWESNQLPTTYDYKDDQFKGKIGSVGTVSKTKYASLNSPDVEIGWQYVTYYIRGLQPETSYYIKARRFLKDTETRETDSYGAYSDYTGGSGTSIVPVETKPKPYEVKLYAPPRLVAQKDFSVSWVYDLDDAQKGYQLLCYQKKPESGEVEAAGKAVTLFENGTKEDSAPYAVVPWSKVQSCLVGPEGRKNRLYTSVRVYTEDGAWSKQSDIEETQIVYPPKASISPIPPVQELPFVVTVGTDDPQCSIVLRVVSRQLMGWGPQGADNVAEGSIVYSTKINTPQWVPTTLAEGKGSWYCYDVTLGEGIPFRDMGSYIVEYTAVNDEYDVDSDTVDTDGNVVRQSTEFSVKFSDAVTVPQFYVVVDPLDEDHSGYAYISIMDTPGENEGCVVDLYRVTPDGSYLVYEGLSDWRNATLIDRLPPYSRHEPAIYRLAIRSANGVTDWSDRSYAMPGYSVRFDWGDPQSEDHGVYNHLTLPYNLKWSDSWAKNSRVDLHLDGTYNGYWRGGVDHKNTLSTELVKLSGAEQVARVRALAQYAGPVMVRLPNGCAFAADVQVNNLDTSYDSLTIAASFSAQEIRLPAKFSTDVVGYSAGLYVPMG